MQCLYPKLLYTAEKVFEVPCNRCIGCRIARSREWSIRLMHEFEYWDKSIFVTLTYSPDNVPPDGGLCKRDLTLFFKRLRKRVVPIVYFACGEYGERFDRPHYHAIIFGIGIQDQKLIEEAWDYGFVKCGTVTYDSCRYVSDYVFKAYNGDKAKEVFGDREVPFRVNSHGIGLRWAQDHESQLVDNNYLTMYGVKHGLPAYYRKKLQILQVQSELDESLSDHNSYMDELDDRGVSLKSVRKHQDLTINARIDKMKAKL